MPASTDDRNLDGLTFEAWLAQMELPPGFREWGGSWQHWRRAHPIGWAVSCYFNSKTWLTREYKRRKRISNALKKSARITSLPAKKLEAQR